MDQDVLELLYNAFEEFMTPDESGEPLLLAKDLGHALKQLDISPALSPQLLVLMDPESTGSITFEQFSTVCAEYIGGNQRKTEEPNGEDEYKGSPQAPSPMKDEGSALEKDKDAPLDSGGEDGSGDSDDAGGFDPEDYDDSEEDYVDSDVDRTITAQSPSEESPGEESNGQGLRNRRSRASARAARNRNKGSDEELDSTRDHVFDLMQNGKGQITSASLRRVADLLKFNVPEEDLKQMAAMASNSQEFGTLWERLKMQS